MDEKRYRDKVIMKQILKKHNIRVPEFAEVESASDIMKFVKKHGLPIVVKPRFVICSLSWRQFIKRSIPRRGYSSVGTCILKTEKDMEELFTKSFGSNYIDPVLGLEVEKFIAVTPSFSVNV
jgi:carbamoylphosphate synthase large subunit